MTQRHNTYGEKIWDYMGRKVLTAAKSPNLFMGMLLEKIRRGEAESYFRQKYTLTNLGYPGNLDRVLLSNLKNFKPL